MENTVWIRHFYRSIAICSDQQKKILLSLQEVTKTLTLCRARECNALVGHSFLEGAVEWRVQVLDSGRLWKKIRHKKLLDLCSKYKNTTWQYITLSLCHSHRSHPNNPSYIDWNGYYTSSFHFGENIWEVSSTKRLSNLKENSSFQILLYLFWRQCFCIIWKILF